MISAPASCLLLLPLICFFPNLTNLTKMSSVPHPSVLWPYSAALMLRSSSLHQAVSSGDTSAIRAMLADGSDVNAKNDGGQTPIILAIVTGQYQLIELFLDAHADPFLQDHTGLNAIQWAQRKGRTDLADSLSHYSRLDTRQGDVTRPRPEQKTPPRSEATDERVPLSADEKSRRFIAGLKQRLDEKAIREVPDSPSEPIHREAPAPTPKARIVPVTSNTPANEDRLHTSPLHEEED